MSDRAGEKGPSTALLAAQERLVTLQKQRRLERQRQSLPVVRESGRCLLPSPSQKLNPVPELPNHLGWASAPLTAALRSRQQQALAEQARREAERLDWLQQSRPTVAITETSPPICRRPASQTVKLYPDLCLAMLRQEQVAAGRIWLLLRYLDATGRGWLSLTDVRRWLTTSEREVRVCGRRQLRNLLSQGDGTFWRRSPDRLWLQSTVRVAAHLGVRRLRGRPVAVPISHLTQSIGTVRAHLYATFHSSRGASTSETPMPIARSTLKRLSGVGRHSQRRYEQKAGVRKRTNYALGSRATVEREQKRAWQHGRALFRFCDHRGRLGQSSETYLAWQLPNSYEGPHAPEPKGRQKRFNRQLADLFMQGITGNGVAAMKASDDLSFSQRYYRNGRLAGKGYNQSSHQDAYWRSSTAHSNVNRYRLWHLLPGQEAT